MKTARRINDVNCWCGLIAALVVLFGGNTLPAQPLASAPLALGPMPPTASNPASSPSTAPTSGGLIPQDARRAQPAAPPAFLGPAAMPASQTANGRRAAAAPPQPMRLPLVDNAPAAAPPTADTRVQRAGGALQSTILQPIEPAGYQETAKATASDAPSTPQQVLINAEPATRSDAWSLEQVEATAVQYNPVLRRGVARIESARGDALQAGLYPNPRFDTNNPEVFAGPASSYNVGFMQDIVVKGKLRLDRAAATEVVRQKEHGLTQDRYELLKAVRQQFYVVLTSQRRVEVLKQIREITATAARAAEVRVNAGTGTQPEMLVLQTDNQRAQIALRTAETNLAADRRQLAAIIGRPDLTIPQVRGPLTTNFPEYDADGLRGFVLAQNAQVQVARREIERNQILLRRARVEPYPNVRVGPAYSNNLLTAPGSQQFWFTVQFDIPTWNRNQGNIRSTEADVADAIASLGVLQNSLLAQVEDVLGRYRAARQSEEKIRTEILPTATKAQQMVRQGYELGGGVLDISTYLQAQRTLSDVSMSYIDALVDVWSSAIEIATLLQSEQFP